MASDVVRATVDVAGERIEVSGRCLLLASVDADGRAQCYIGGDMSAVRTAMMADCAVTSSVRAAEEIFGSALAAKGLIRIAAMRAVDTYGENRGKAVDLTPGGAIRDLAEELGVEVPDVGAAR